MTVTFIGNPLAGGGRGRRALADLDSRQKEIGKALGEPIEIRTTVGPGHGQVLARQATDGGSRIVVAVGGDGLIHEVVNGLRGSRAALGIVPAGSGNDIARALGIPRSPARALEVLSKGSVRQIDLGRIGDRYFVGFAGMGFDALAVSLWQESRAPLRGKRLYTWGVLRALRRYRLQEMTLDVDGQKVSGRGWLAVASNTPNFGGGIVIAPGARLDDGLLDLTVVADVSRIEFMLLFIRVLLKRPVNHPAVQRFLIKSARITGDPGLIVQADGEILGHPPMEIQILPGSLPVLIPA